MSARPGSASRHWRNQRLTAIALIPLGLWFLVSLLRQPSLEHAVVAGWFAKPLQALLATLLGAALLWFGIPGSALAGAVTVAFGVAGVTASACIYRVPARPAWNTRHTIAHFHLTAGILGPLFASAAGVGGSPSARSASFSAARKMPRAMRQSLSASRRR